MASTLYGPFAQALSARVLALLAPPATTLVQSGFSLVQGRLEGPMTDLDRGSVWVEEAEEMEDNVDVERIDAVVRVYKRFYERRGGDIKPFDPAVLYEIAEVLQTGLRATMTTSGVWYFRVTAVRFLLETQGVELTVAGWVQNLYELNS